MDIEAVINYIDVEGLKYISIEGIAELPIRRRTSGSISELSLGLTINGEVPAINNRGI